MWGSQQASGLRATAVTMMGRRDGQSAWLVWRGEFPGPRRASRRFARMGANADRVTSNNGSGTVNPFPGEKVG